MKYLKGMCFEIKGSTITLEEKLTGRDWIVTCSKCSEDSELWPYGSMVIKIGSLTGGSLPCSCSNSAKYTENQNMIRVKRECKNRGYIFIRWDGEYKNLSKTGFVAYDTLVGKEVIIRYATKFLAGEDSNERTSNKIRQSKLKDDSYYTELFNSNGCFEKGTVFKRCEDVVGGSGRFDRWKYWCPTCANDDIALSAFGCSGWFPSNYNSLKSGMRACRCAKQYRYSVEENEVRLKNLIDKEGCFWGGWVTNQEGFSNNSKKFEWYCKKGHKNSTSVNNFLRGRRCSSPECKYKNSAVCNNYGFYEGRELDLDYLYIIRMYNENESFIKIGRSFSPPRRFQVLRKKYEIEELYLESGMHKDIWLKESMLHEKYTVYHYTPLIPFKGGVFECFSMEVLTHISKEF